MSSGLNSASILALVRQLLSDMDVSGSGRWTDATLYNFIDRAHKRIVGDVLFPDCRIVQNTFPGAQLYQFPLMLKVKAVYVAGQLAVPSDIPTLEGRQIGEWDATSTGSTTAGPYSDAATGTAGGSAPQWAVQEPLSYPTSDGTWVTPAIAPDAQPWDASQRPRYYWRGGWLGLVPAPANTKPVAIVVDGVRQPNTITGSTALTTPENFLDVIAWDAVALAKFADDGQRADQQRQIAEQSREREKRKLLTWRGEYPGEQRNGPKVSVLRGMRSNTGYVRAGSR